MTLGESRFTAIYQAHYRRVYLYCRRRLESDQVDDAVADTFLAAWRKIDQVPDGDAALLWLYAAARRVLMHTWRGASRKRRLEGRLKSLGIDVPTAPEDYVLASDDSRQVIAAASRLKPSDQEILRLSLWEELPHSDIANVLELSADAVRQRLSRALKSLTREFNRLEKRRRPTPAAQEGGAQ